MNQRKREYRTETLSTIEKREDVNHKSVRCVSCNKIIAEVGEVVMGRVLVQCGHCGVKNRIDHTANETRRGRYLS